MLVNAVFLDLKVETVAKDLLQFKCLLPGPIHVVMGDPPGDFAMQAGGQSNQSFLVLKQEFPVYTGLVIESFRLGNGCQFHQVLVAGSVHGQQNNMKVVACSLIVDEMAFLGNIKLAADQWLNSGFFCLGIELQSPVHGTMISNGNGIHAVFQAFVDQIAQTDSAVQHGVLGVYVQVNKGCRHGITVVELEIKKCRTDIDRAG